MRKKQPTINAQKWSHSMEDAAHSMVICMFCSWTSVSLCVCVPVHLWSSTCISLHIYLHIMCIYIYIYIDIYIRLSVCSSCLTFPLSFLSYFPIFYLSIFLCSFYTLFWQQPLNGWREGLVFLGICSGVGELYTCRKHPQTLTPTVPTNLVFLPIGMILPLES